MTYNDKWTEEPEEIEIGPVLVVDEELFPRERIDQKTVDEYIEVMRDDPKRFPPIRIIKSQAGRLMLIDGRHRVQAAHTIGLTKFRACVRSGEWSDAVEAAAAQNIYGKARTDADKRRAITMVLGLAEWADASDRLIARHCAVSHHLVAKVRAEARAALGGGHVPSPDQPIENTQADPPRLPPPPPDLRRGEDGKVRDVSRQGAAAERMRQRMREWEPEPEPSWGRPPTRGPSPPPVMSEADYGISTPVRAPSGPITRMPRPTTLFDMEGWLADAPDSERLVLGGLLVRAIDSDANRRRLADDAFKEIGSDAEKLKHDEVVQLWLAEHEAQT